MTKLPKYIQIAELLENRILHGDYILTEFPTERGLAEEMDVSTITARKAFQVLEGKKLIVKKDNGRPGVPSRGEGRDRDIHVAFLVPAAASFIFDDLFQAARKVALSLRVSIRPVHFVHWDDPVIINALEAYDSVMLVPPLETPPQTILDLIHNSETPVAVVGSDYSEMGIPSFFQFKHEFIQELLDYMASFGHRKIDYFNTSTLGPIGYKGLEQWELWIKKHKSEGEIINNPVPPYEDAGLQAYEIIKTMLKSGTFNSTALVCTTGRTALGVMRAFYEEGIVVGKDVSVASMSGDNIAALLGPALTALEGCPAGPFLKIILEWMLEGGKDWDRPLLLAPDEMTLVKGETVGMVAELVSR